MSTELATQPAPLDQATMIEYNVSIEGVVEIMAGMDDKPFFDGFLDAVSEYVEKWRAFAGLTMSHQKYVSSAADDYP